MKLAQIVLTSAAFAFAAACHAGPTPPPDSPLAPTEPATETPAETAPVVAPPAPVRPPKVGGPCAYRTDVITALVERVEGGQVFFANPDGRSYSMNLSQFAATPEAGEYYNVNQRTITMGTCVPVMRTLTEPVEPVAPSAD
jgi:hypothetical protein